MKSKKKVHSSYTKAIITRCIATCFTLIKSCKVHTMQYLPKSFFIVLQHFYGFKTNTFCFFLFIFASLYFK